MRADFVTLDPWREPDVLEVQPGAGRRLGFEAERDSCVDPLARLHRLARRVDVAVNASPADLLVGLQAIDQHDLAGLIETKRGLSADFSGYIAGGCPPTTQPLRRGERGNHSCRRRGDRQFATKMFHDWYWGVHAGWIH